MPMITRFLLDLLYPNRCPCCGELIRFDSLVCRECVRKLSVFTEDMVCHKCGRDSCICERQPEFDRCFCFCAYEGVARDGVLAFKNGTSANFAEYLGERLADMLDDAGITRADYVIPAPVTKKNRSERGYNQSKLIAKPITRRLNAKGLDILRCTPQSAVQHELKAEQRMLNTQSFTVKDVRLDGKSVILCDDIITTGSTVLRCSELLRGLGAESLYVAVGTGTSRLLCNTK